MNFCEDCGAPLSPGVRFCENCGAKIPDSDVTVSAFGKDESLPENLEKSYNQKLWIGKNSLR